MKCPACRKTLTREDKLSTRIIQCGRCGKKLKLKEKKKQQAAAKLPDGTRLRKGSNDIEIVVPVKERGALLLLIIAGLFSVAIPVMLISGGEFYEIGIWTVFSNLSMLVIGFLVGKTALNMKFGEVKFKVNRKQIEILTGYKFLATTQKVYWSEIDEVKEVMLQRTDLTSKLLPPGYTVQLSGIKREVT
ncbi:MAG: hypothetical protein WBA74_13385, partial [Cyclobacteriaceae bacterium]